MSLTHTYQTFPAQGSTPAQIELKFDFAYDELSPRSAVEDAQKYVEDTAVFYEATWGVGNVYTVNRHGIGIPNRGKR